MCAYTRGADSFGFVHVANQNNDTTKRIKLDEFAKANFEAGECEREGMRFRAIKRIR